jgi:hypothetical protein
MATIMLNLVRDPAVSPCIATITSTEPIDGLVAKSQSFDPVTKLAEALDAVGVSKLRYQGALAVFDFAGAAAIELTVAEARALDLLFREKK